MTGLGSITFQDVVEIASLDGLRRLLTQAPGWLKRPYRLISLSAKLTPRWLSLTASTNANGKRPVSFAAYMRQDLRMITNRARGAYQDEQKRALKQARAVILSKRSKEATRGRLESIVSTLPENQALSAYRNICA